MRKKKGEANRQQSTQAVGDYTRIFRIKEFKKKMKEKEK